MPQRSKAKPFFAFIDASNLFYGGEKSLGWKIDYSKLLSYIKKQYRVSKVFYYGGVELNGFLYSQLEQKAIDLSKLLAHIQRELKEEKRSKERQMQLTQNTAKVKFYIKLGQFGYKLLLKPVKMYREPDGRTTKKANCDVDMTFDLMYHLKEYSGALVLSGDGDFVVVLKHLKKMGKKVIILARGERTAREIRQLAGGDFRDFSRLRTKLEFKP